MGKAPELRFNLATGEWVIIAPGRARRPEEYARSRPAPTHTRSEHEPTCPFCPGSESHTPGETLRLENQEGWVVRCFPNRYPALHESDRAPGRRGGLYAKRMQGFGRHELVAESPLHNTTLALLSQAEVGLVLRAWRQRYRALAYQPGIEYVVIFKNHGAGAGTSLEHPHSQVVALPVLPSQVRTRLEGASRFYNETGHCLFCRMRARELKAGSRIVSQSSCFTTFVPFASASPYSLWILPNRHISSFSDVNDEELSELARILQDGLARLYHGLGDPDFNLVVRSAHPQALSSGLFHFYITIVPRMSQMAGFEIGTGMFINSSLPEADAAYLRGVSLPERAPGNVQAAELVLAPGERLDVVDLEDRVVGWAHRRTVRQENLLHRSVAVLTFNSQGEVYVHQRTSNKDFFPSVFSMFVTGLVLQGESYDEAAVRELLEELGVPATPEFVCAHLFLSALTRVWIRVYYCHWDGPVVHSSEEVQWGQWMPVGRLTDWVHQVPITPDSLDCFFRLRRGGELDRVTSVTD